jgi:hypothetical protein
MDIIHKEHLEKFLIDIVPVCKKSSKQSTVAGAV